MNPTAFLNKPLLFCTYALKGSCVPNLVFIHFVVLERDSDELVQCNMYKKYDGYFQVLFFQTVANDQSEKSNKSHQKELNELMSQLPPQAVNGHTKTVKRQPSTSKGIYVFNWIQSS